MPFQMGDIPSTLFSYLSVIFQKCVSVGHSKVKFDLCSELYHNAHD